MDSMYAEGNISKIAASDDIPFGALVARNGSGKCQATSGNGASAVNGVVRTNYLGVAVGDKVDDKDRTGFYSSGEEVPIAPAHSGRQVTALVAGDSSYVQLGDYLQEGAFSATKKSGTMKLLTDATASAAQSQLRAKDAAIAKAIEEVDVSTMNRASCQHVIIGTDRSLSFTSSQFSLLNVKAGDYIAVGSSTAAIVRVTKTAGYVVTVDDTVGSHSIANTGRIKKLVPIRAILC